MSRPQTDPWGYRLLTPYGPEYANFRQFDILDDLDAMGLGIPLNVLKDNAQSLTEFVRGEHATVVAEHLERMLHLLLETHTRMLSRDHPSGTVVLLEPVPDRDFVLVGYRVWWYTDIHEFEPGDVIQFGIMEDNAIRKRDQESGYYARTQRMSPNAKYFKFHDIDMDSYLSSCEVLVQGQLYAGRREVRSKLLSDKENPANPRFVFGLNNAMSSIANAHPDWCRVENYMTRHGQDREYNFPQNSRFEHKIIRLTPQQAQPREFCSVYAPHIRAASDTAHWRDKMVFYQGMLLREQMRQNSEDAADDFDRDETVVPFNPFDMPVSHPQAFEFAIASQTKTDLQWRIEKLRDSNEGRRAAIEHGRLLRFQQGQSMAQVDKWASEQRRANFKQGMSEFSVAVWNENANISEELKTVIRWGQHYLTEHNNFHCDRPKMTKNLPTSTEWLTCLTFYAEFWLYMFFHHEYLGLLMLQQFNAYDMAREGVRLHYLGTGPPGTGKSVLLNWGGRLFIPDTVVSITYETLKAKMSVPKLPNGERTIDNSISQCHERSNDEMGIGLTNSKAGASAEKANMKKDWLDNGRAACKRSRKDDSGDWVTDTIFVKCIGTESGNTNWPAHVLDKAYRDRVCIASFVANPQRADKTLADVQSITPSPSMDRMRDSLARDIRCKQYLRALIGYLEFVGLMPRVHTKASMEVISQVMKVARQKYGLRKDLQARTTSKLEKICREMAIQTGLYHLFSAETSPLRNKRWELADIEGMQYWMYSTVGHAVQALGMLKDSELEDRTRYRILKVMQQLWFTPQEVVVEVPPQDGKDAKRTTTTSSDIMEKMRARLKPYYFRSQELKSADDLFGSEPRGGNGSGAQWMYRSTAGEANQDYVYAPDVFTPRQRQTPAKPAATTAAVTPVAAASSSSSSSSADVGMKDAAPANGPSQQNRLFFKTQDEKFEYHARIIRHAFNDGEAKPDMSEIVAHLKDMTKDATMTDDKRDVTTMIYVEDGLVLATNALLKNHPSPIRAAIPDVLEHKQTKATRYPFTCGWDGKPWLFSCIDIKPDSSKDFEVTNATYADTQQRKVLNNLAPRDEKGKPIVDLNEIYARTATSKVEEDLEERELKTHLFSIHWSQEDVKRWDFAPERVMDARYVAAAEERLGESLPMYPEEMCERSSGGGGGGGGSDKVVPMVDVDSPSSSSSSSSSSTVGHKRKADEALGASSV